MQKETLRLTASQFAKLHKVNKRTLHYYDDIGLFSPRHRGENGYRYYDYSQSIDFEYIRMLKEIHLSLEEIRAFIHAFDRQKFLETVSCKQREIDLEIQRLQSVKEALAQKKEHLLLCQKISDMQIEISEYPEEYLLTIPYKFEEDHLTAVFQYIQSLWPPEQYRAGVGSYISLEKVRAKQFDSYDGLYTPAAASQQAEHTLRKPAGSYLCGYLKGSWDRLPQLYEKLLAYARSRRLLLTGYAFERELNDFSAAREEDSVTQVMIRLAGPQNR